MLFVRSHVFCSECGFLGWRTELPDGSWKPDKLSECGLHARQSLQAGEFNGEDNDYETGESYKLHCLRLQWTLLPHARSQKMRWVDANAIRQPRRCAYFIKYEPGFGPDEHKELKRDDETRRAIRNATLLGAAIGASAAIIAQLLYVLFASL
jgi:hypothetical protein